MVFRRRKLKNQVQTLIDEMLHVLRHESANSADEYRPRPVQAARLESRVLMSASPMAVVAEAVSPAPADAVSSVSVIDTGLTDFGLETPDLSELSQTELPQTSYESISSDASTELSTTPIDVTAVLAETSEALQDSGPELIVIDYRVQDADTLLFELLSTDRDFRILRLDSETDGISQITQKLQHVGNVSAIHLLTHGAAGEILLGSTILNADTLAQHAPELLAWQHSLTANADLLLYGCDVAESPEGEDFVESLSRLTGADVAASTNATGSERFGGDWTLEYERGVIETQVFGSSVISGDWNDLLGVITVGTTTDVLDGDTSSVAALLASKGIDGFISLREAIIATNNTAGADTIFLTAGTFTFAIGGQGENAAFAGDLDITDSLTITGAGSGLSTIDASSLDRVFELRGAISMTIEDVTIRGGSTPSSNWGGGILTDNGSTLNLSRVVVTGNSTGSGAGIYNYGTLVATDTIISNNTGSDWGGGLYNDGGSVTLNRVTISGNSSGKDGGGINDAGSGAAMSLTNVTLSGNSAVNNGGGLWTSRSVTATNVTIAFNDAASGDGIFMQGGGADVLLRNSVLYNTSGVNANRAMSSLGNNIDSDSTAGLTGPADQSGINPLLDATLQNNGGFVTTHRLLSGSSAIDTGSMASGPSVDARNTARDGAPDIGAYEVQGLLASRAESLVNTATTNTQSTSSESRGSTRAVAAARDGSHVVVWSSLNQDSGGWGVYGQRFDAAGNKVGVEFLINQTTTDDQKFATVAMNGRGDFVVSWTSVNQDGSGNGVYARRYDAAGTALGNEFRVGMTSTGDQDSPVVAMASDGRFLIVWEGQGAGDTDGIFGRWYGANGAPSGSESLVNSTTSGVQGEPSVSMAPDGRAVVVWSDSNGVWAQQFDNIGGPEGPGEIHIESNITSGSPDVEMAADGSFVVAYRQTLFDAGVYFRRFDADGTPLNLFAQIANATSLGNQTNPSIAMDDTGNFLIVWEGAGTGDTDGVFGRHFTASGTALNSFEFRINGTTTGTQSMASAAMLTGGSFVVTWSGAAAADSSGVYTRQFVNTPPTITTIPNQTIPENGTTGLLSFTIGDAESSSFILAVTASSSNSGLVSPGGLVLAGFGANRTLTVIPNPNQSGTATITVNVDDSSTITSSTFLLTVTDVNGAPVITSNGGGASSTISVAENSTSITTVTATDADLPAQTLPYSISGGADASKFSINSTTGVLTFLTAPNYETPTDNGSNNVYDVIVQVSDGMLTDTQTIAVTVTALNDNTPIITSNLGGATAAISVTENAISVTTVTATDADLPTQTLTYAISGGADAAKFAINSTNGVLTFVTAPDFEAPTDSGSNKVYDVIVRVSDGTFTDAQSIAVTITNANDNAPVIAAGQSFSVSELAANGISMGIVTATDADGGTTFSNWTITAGNNDGIFAIDATTGELTVVDRTNLNFNITPSYSLSLTVSDGTTNSAVKTIAITVADSPNNAPVASGDNYTVTEGGTLNQTAVSGWFNSNWQYRQQLVFDNSASSTNLNDAVVLVKLHASAADALHIDYSATQNAGQDLRFVDSIGNTLAYQIEQWDETSYSYVWVKVPQITAGSVSGSISMYYGNATAQAGQNSESVWSSNNVVVYHMNTNAIDSTSYANSGGVSNVVIAPGIFSGAGAFDGLTSLINSGSAASVDNIFSGGGTISAWINPTSWGEGGYGRIADKGTSTTGALGWGWQVAGTTGSDGYLIFENDFTGATGRWRTAAGSVALNTWQDVVVTYDNSSTSKVPKIFVNGVQLAVTQTSTPTGVAESDAAQNLFIGNRSGASDRTFSGMIDEVRISSTALTADQIKADFKSGQGTFVSSTGVVSGPGALLENDLDPDSDRLTVTLVSGPAHAASFTLNADGSFSYVHDGSETAIDSFTYRISDGTLTDTTTVSLTLTPVNDSVPVITSGQSFSVSENAAAGTTLGTVTATDGDAGTTFSNWTITGGNNAGVFAINSNTGAISIANSAALDYETATTHTLIVTVFDGVNTSLPETVNITVLPINDNNPVITSNGGGATASISVAENATAVTTVTATDADLPSQTLTYSISGGADAAKFSINSSTGALRFVTAPNFDVPADSGANNVYDVIVRVSDGTFADTQAIAVIVTSVNDNAPVITSNGGGATSSINVDENSTAVTIVAATDADLPSQTLTYSISGGLDAAGFTINSSTGVLSFVAARDYEVPTDHGANNVYNVIVRVSDGSFTDTQAIAVTINPVNDSSPTITSGGGGLTAAITVAENSIAVTTVTATDADLPSQTLTYSISGGADAAKFAINSSTGALTFVSAQDFEVPADANLDNIYDVVVSVSDGTLVDTQTLAVTVAPVNDNNPVITSNGGGGNATISVAENSTTVTTVTATDADLPAQTLAYSISGGSDASKFTINASTGELKFTSSPNFEVPVDSNLNNIYNVTVRVSDGSRVDTQTIFVTVTNVNEAPVITSYGGAAVAQINVAENTTLVTTVTSTDVDGAVPVYSIVSGTDGALFSIDSATGVLRFVNSQDFDTPNDANGDNIFVVGVQVSDGNGATDFQLVNVHLTNVNETPDGTPMTPVSVLEDAPSGTVSVAAAYQDPDRDALTFSITQVNEPTPLFRSLTINATNGIISYDLRANANGAAVINIQARDAGGLFVMQQLSFNVQAVNDAPQAFRFTGSTLAEQTLSMSSPGLLQSVTDVDGDLLQAVLIQAPANGSLVLQSNGSFVYTPNAGYIGNDTFLFAASDGQVRSVTQTATITVLPPVVNVPAGSGLSGGSSGSSGAGGTSTSGNFGTGSGSSGSGSNSTGGTGTSANTNSGGSNSTGTGINANPAPPTTVVPVSVVGTGEGAAMQDDEEVGIIMTTDPAVIADNRVRSVAPSLAPAASDLTETSERIQTRRTLIGAIGFSDRAVSSDSASQAAARVLHLQREAVYQTLIQQNLENVEGFEERISERLSISDQVVGSVGVVTTSFSVGYLIWAVRFGTLLSGLLTQIPTWSMLDPLLVIDGETKDEDKESLQSIVDRQQTQITPNVPPQQPPQQPPNRLTESVADQTSG